MGTRIILIFLVCGLLISILSIGEAHAGGWIEYDAFFELVAETRLAVAQAGTVESGAMQERLAELAGEWETVDEVRMPDGSYLPVDTAYLAALLMADKPDLASIRDLLTFLESRHLSRLEPAPELGGLRELEEILSAPEFDWEPLPEEPQPQEEPEDESFLAQLLNGLVDFFFALGPGFQVLLAALVLGLVFFSIFRGTFANLTAEIELAAEDEQGELLTPTGAMSRAMELSKGGDYRSAVRYLYLSGLLQLERAGLLRYDHAKTNREYLQGLKSNPATAAKLGDVVGVYERVWYGFEEIDETTFRDYTREVSDLGDDEA